MAPTRRMRFVRDIPVPVRQTICDFFDDITAFKTWKHLAGLMGFSNDEISLFQRAMMRPGGSPTDELLTAWDHENHTIEQLYRKLFEIRHARCMMLLKDFVDPSLHYLINQITNTPPLSPEQPRYNPGIHGNPDHQVPANIPASPMNHENHFARSYSQQPPQPEMQPAYQPAHYPQQQQQQQQHQPPPQHMGQQGMMTPSTVSYHSSNKPNFTFQPVDPHMMMSTIAQHTASTTSNNMSPQPSYDRPFNASPQGGNDLMRVPSEHPIGSPQRYKSQHSNDDNLAPPPALSPQTLSTSKPPVFQSIPPLNHSTSQDSSVEQCLSATIEVPYEKLCKATDNFSHARRLGAGAFGEVFHAQLDMIDVAIKKIIKNDNVVFNQAMIRRDQIKEIQALTMYRHKNIVSLTAYSFGEGCLCLIFDYMKNGSLEQLLENRQPREPLPWRRRHRIAEGAALGIQYLHTAQSTPLIHQDIKSANILLDENFVAKIADFGLARPGPSQGKEYTAIKTSVVFGTMAYLAPEFIQDSKRKLSPRLDVYSFGVVLMEMVTGLKAGQAKERLKYHNLLTSCVDKIMSVHKGDPDRIVSELRDPRCPDWPSHYVMDLLQLALKCTETFKFRPEMEVVYNSLSDIELRIEQEENKNNDLSRAHMYPIENTEPLEHRPGVESSDPSLKTDSLVPGGAQFGGQYQQYGGFHALDAGRMNPNRDYANEPKHEEIGKQFEQCQIRPQVPNQGMRQEASMRHVPAQHQIPYYPTRGGYPREPLPPGMGHVPMHVNPPPTQSVSQSPASSYPSTLPSSSVTSSSDSSSKYWEPYPGQPRPADPSCMDAQHWQQLQQQRTVYRPDMAYQHGTYPEQRVPHQYGNVAPDSTQSPGGSSLDSSPVYYQHPDFRPNYQHGGPPMEYRSYQRDEPVPNRDVADGPLIPRRAGRASSPERRYPKVPTIHLSDISLESSDTSNLMSQTSVRTFSDQGSNGAEEPGMSDCKDAKPIGERTGSQEGGSEKDQAGEGPRGEDRKREPSQNTEPQG